MWPLQAELLLFYIYEFMTSIYTDWHDMTIDKCRPAYAPKWSVTETHSMAITVGVSINAEY